MKLLLFTILFPFFAVSIEPEKLLSLFSSSSTTNDWIEELNSIGACTQPLQELPQETNTLPLFDYYPGLQKLPHISLCTLPTPIKKLNDAGSLLQLPELYVKDDSVLGFPHYSGNKPRKLEFELARALMHGASAIVTFGCVGSNHAVATSEYARLLGMECLCMLQPELNSHDVRNTLLLHSVLGTQLHYYPNSAIRKIGTLCTWLEYKNKYGTYPYVIPTGGSTPLGVVGFVNAAFELKEQIDAGIIPKPDCIYLACGNTVSGATTAGLLLGCKAANLSIHIRPIAVEPEDYPGQTKNTITTLFKTTNALLHSIDSQFPLYELTKDDYSIDLRFTGIEYALFTPEGMHAKQLMHHAEAITLDGVYTAKAFAAVIADAQQGILNNKKVLFWNTYSSFDTKRIQDIDYKELPVCFHAYFEEEVQELDRMS